MPATQESITNTTGTATAESLTKVTAGALIQEGLYSALFDKMLFEYIAFDYAEDTQAVRVQTTPSATSTKESLTTTTA